MIRKDTGRPSTGGRRPLLVTFVGNNRHMLTEIRDSLSHLRRYDHEGYNNVSLSQLKPELSQSTPNLLEKSSGCKMTRRDNQHHKALAEIRDSLRPYQNTSSGTASSDSSGVGSGYASSSASSTSSHTTCDAENNVSKIQKIMQYGYDEDIAVQALLLSGNQSVDGALRLLTHIKERLAAGVTGAGPPYYNQMPHFAPSSPMTSETNSVRSDSPTLNTAPQRHLFANGLTTPPPLPPRAPISVQANHTSHGQTPPTFSDTVGMVNNRNVIGHQPLSAQSSGLLQTVNQVKGQPQSGMLTNTQNNIIPQGHVQQMIKRMSPGQAYQKQPVNGMVGAMTTQGGVSPVAPSSCQQPFISASNNGNTPDPGSLVSQQLQNLRLENQNINPSGASQITTNSVAVTPAGRAQAPPPPYNQARLQVAMVKGFSSGVPQIEHPQQLDVHHTSFIQDNPVSMHEAAQIIQKKMISPAAVPATRMAMGLHMPVIMPSVRSKEVTKPMPQTATAPLAPPAHSMHQNGGLLPNHITQVKGHTNNISSSPNQHLLKDNQQMVIAGQLPGMGPPGRDFQIPVNHAPQNIFGGGNHFTVEQLTALAASQSHTQSFQQQQNLNQFFHSHMTLHNSMSSPGAALSTPRSDSPASRATSQSPMSILSTTSSPSTNSDVPDMPPPQYSRQTVVSPGVRSAPHVNPPQLPPRIPMKDKPPPPIPSKDQNHSPYFGAQVFSPPSSATTTSLPTPSSSSSPPLKNTSSAPMFPSPQTDVTNTADDQIESSPHLITSKVVGCTPHSETSETDKDQNHESLTKCSTTNLQEKHRCMSPLPQRKSEARERDRLRCDTNVKVYSTQAFKFYMEQHVENVLKSHGQRMNRRLQLEKEMAKVKLSDEAAQQMRKMLHQKESNYIRLKRAKMDSSMFEEIQTLGVGAFGEVTLVRKKDVGSLYAMKTLKKSNVIKRNQVAHVKAERDILAEADNEWVVKLYYSFQDSNYLYFVMDYVPGGDLMGLLIRKEILEEHLAQFYVAELVLAIESVHKMGFIHRDIKPDNILIDRDGHIKLTDFGLCTGFRWTHNSKYYQRDGIHARQDSMDAGTLLDDQYEGEVLKPLEQRRQREQKRDLAHSLVGTPNYIAPEVLLRSGYTKACDWWSVGVILYEMVIGRPPFYASTPAETQHKVINWKQTLSFHYCTNISPATIDLIVRLLQGPETRLGRNGATEVKEHPFFAGINFQGLRRQPAPLKPVIRYLTDTSNFDPVDPDKLRTNDSESSKKADSKLENGKHSEHAFYEFTFRRFFDDGGHPCTTIAQQDQESNSPVYV